MSKSSLPAGRGGSVYEVTCLRININPRVATEADFFTVRVHAPNALSAPWRHAMTGTTAPTHLMLARCGHEPAPASYGALGARGRNSERAYGPGVRICEVGDDERARMIHRTHSHMRAKPRQFCSELVEHDGFVYRPCGRPAKVVVEGRTLCDRHSPQTKVAQAEQARIQIVRARGMKHDEVR